MMVKIVDGFFLRAEDIRGIRTNDERLEVWTDHDPDSPIVYPNLPNVYMVDIPSGMTANALALDVAIRVDKALRGFPNT